jgi:hypothetical protein
MRQGEDYQQRPSLTVLAERAGLSVDNLSPDQQNELDRAYSASYEARAQLHHQANSGQRQLAWLRLLPWLAIALAMIWLVFIYGEQGSLAQVDVVIVALIIAPFACASLLLAYAMAFVVMRRTASRQSGQQAVCAAALIVYLIIMAVVGCVQLEGREHHLEHPRLVTARQLVVQAEQRYEQRYDTVADTSQALARVSPQLSRELRDHIISVSLQQLNSRRLRIRLTYTSNNQVNANLTTTMTTAAR